MMPVTALSHRTRRLAYLMRLPVRLAEAGGIRLRPYQQLAIQAVVDSVRKKRSLSIVWIFPRQSGKDEALAILVQYLLAFLERDGAEMVFFNPTFKPQTETSMRRLETRLRSNPVTIGRWSRRSGYIYQMNNAYCTYLSADPTAHVVSATASILLIVNEAQDVTTLKYDKDIAPMASSTNATRLFSGTRWTSDTLLERQYQDALRQQREDGLRRVFFFTADDVRLAVPQYGVFVDDAVSSLGRQHPLVKTQYFCETTDAEAGMFPPGSQVLMAGSHAARTVPEPGSTYAFLVDVAGQISHGTMKAHADPYLDGNIHSRRDSTFLKIVEIDLASVDLLGKPSYKVLYRQEWVGASHVTVFGALRALVRVWDPIRIVIDATGVGEGLWSLLDHAFGESIVIPVKFTSRVKSDLGYAFLAMVDMGRYCEYHPFPQEFRLQLQHCRSEILPGPGKFMRWGVPDGTRDPQTGRYIHDDDLITAAMCTVLDRLDWSPRLNTGIIFPPDPLIDMDSNF